MLNYFLKALYIKKQVSNDWGTFDIIEEQEQCNITKKRKSTQAIPLLVHNKGTTLISSINTTTVKITVMKIFNIT